MANIDDTLSVALQPKEDKRVNIKDILNLIFSKTAIEQKSVLSEENINAVLKMRATNNYLKRNYKFEVDLYNQLISDKLVYVISRKGRGREDIVSIIEGMRDSTNPDDGERRRLL